jgi:hypothetical protein
MKEKETCEFCNEEIERKLHLEPVLIKCCSCGGQDLICNKCNDNGVEWTIEGELIYFCCICRDSLSFEEIITAVKEKKAMEK